MSTVTKTEWNSMYIMGTGFFGERRRGGRIASCIKEILDGMALI